MKEIPITSFRNLKIGQAENTAAGTGCTVFLLGQEGARRGWMYAAAGRPPVRVSCSTAGGGAGHPRYCAGGGQCLWAGCGRQRYAVS